MKVAALLSGGVDSSVALALLRDAGHDVTAFYLKVWLEDELAHLGSCPWEEDLGYARAVCERLGVTLEIVSLQKPYWDRVVTYAIDELRSGRTPSPDIFCNQRVKFGAFLDAMGPGYDAVASGHYARVEHRPEGVVLKKGVDPVKDQTYFLSHLHQEQLARILFPIGELRKADVRRRAAELELANRARKDSQGICFLGKIPYREFVRHHLGEREGDIVDVESGRVLGKHRGYWFHTVGQRQGLGLGHGPWFVRSKDVDANVVYVAHAERLEARSAELYDVDELHWINGSPGKPELHLSVRVRHGQPPVSAEVRVEHSRASIRLGKKEPGIAPGQFTVFYDGDVCLGGARIVG